MERADLLERVGFLQFVGLGRRRQWERGANQGIPESVRRPAVQVLRRGALLIGLALNMANPINRKSFT